MNLRVMRLLAGLTDTGSGLKDRARVRISPALRLVVSVVLIILCALSGNAFFTLCVTAAELLRMGLMKPESVRRALKRCVLPVVFTAVLMIPAVFMGSPGSFGTVTMKVFESVLVLAVLNEDVSWTEMTGALESLHAPSVFVLTLDTTVRFLVILGRYSARLLEAVSLRRVGRKSWKNAGTGGVLGITWLKSRQMIRSGTEAMACRCFDGTYRKNFSFSARTEGQRKLAIAADIMYAMILPLAAAGFAYTQSII